jgi:phospholipase C
MVRLPRFLSAFSVLAGTALLVILGGCGGSSNSGPPAVEVTTRLLAGGSVGGAYDQTLEATGGVAPYTWSISGGALPGGLTMSSAGVITGAPGAPGGFSFTVMATDTEKTPQTATASLSITVATAGSPITHVVVIFQENRTPDNLFQDPVLIANGADIAQSGLDSTGQTVPLAEASLQVDYDPDHVHHSFVSMCDLQVDGVCKMDGANLINVSCLPDSTDCPAPNLNYGYVNPSDVQPYFQLAEQYTFADRMFQTNQGPSFPAHQFILSGTSAPSTGTNLLVSENPNASSAGCDAVSDATVKLIDPTGDENSNAPIYPCFEHPTLTDLLEGEGINWKYYSPATANGLSGYPAIWNAPEAIEHICGPNEPPPNGTVCQGADWNTHEVLNQVQVLTDISSEQLAAVTWVIPEGQASDHPANIPGNEGPSWVSTIVNAIGASPYWGSTAIFITWDDWGGWYDHVPPPQVLIDCAVFGCGYIYGFRVPLIVVSPYAKAAYISHQQHDFGSILKFVEQNFGLPSLDYADAAADNLSDCFNYSQTPISFQAIDAPLEADYFINDTRVPSPPDND